MAEVSRLDEMMALALPVLEARHAESWLVGGWVRDHLLGRPTHDVDFVVPEGAMATARQVGDVLGGAFVALDVERDTARVVVGPPGSAVYMDFAGLRGPTLDDDLRARDFTVNAMAVPAADWQAPEQAVIDPTGGRADLSQGILRAVSAEGLRDDPLRMLRAVRLAALLDFEIESQTAGWIYRDAELLDAVSRERVRDELAQLLDLPAVGHSLRQLDELRLLEPVLPEVERLRAVPVAGRGAENALQLAVAAAEFAQKLWDWSAGAPWGELGSAGEALEASLAPYRGPLHEHLRAVLPGGRRAAQLLILAGLLHDLGRGQAEEGAGLLGHEVLSASLAVTVMRRLCFSSAETVRVRLGVRHYRRLEQMAQEDPAPSRRAIYRFFRDAEPAGPAAILLALAVHLAETGLEPDPEHWQRLLDVSRALLHAYYEQHREIVDPPLAVDGHGLMEALGLRPGPQVGALLERIREAQAAGELSTREQAIRLGRELLERGV